MSQSIKLPIKGLFYFTPDITCGDCSLLSQILLVSDTKDFSFSL